MATSRVCGLETEFGISMRGVAEFNPVIGSSLLVNAYSSNHQIKWDFEDEHPEVDARGPIQTEQQPPEVETGLANVVLTNGARFYVDHAHPEYSTPECLSALEAVVYDEAGVRVIQRAMRAASASLPEGRELLIHKNNSDGKGNSYGCHENYLMDRSVPFGRIVSVLTPFFVTRQIFCGSGKLGAEHGGANTYYQISQRADFIEEEVGLETTLKRPIINTRDEPHADPERYRRLHVILGDANMSQTATLLKLGTTGLVLDMIEDDFVDKDMALASPVGAIRSISRDLTCRESVRLRDGSTATPIQIQWDYFELAKKWSETREADHDRTRLLDLWERILTGLESDPMELYRELDWVAKLRLLSGYRERHGLEVDDPRLALIDLQYHDLRPSKGLYFKMVSDGRMETVVGDDEIERAVTEPPSGTRAYFRGKCIEKFGEQIAAANWDSILFDLGEDPLRRVPMMDPLKGSRAHVGELVDSVDTAEELIGKISQR